MSDFVTLGPGQIVAARHPMFSEFSKVVIKPGQYTVTAQINRINRLEKIISGFDDFCRKNGLTPWLGSAQSGPATLLLVAPGDPATAPAMGA